MIEKRCFHSNKHIGEYIKYYYNNDDSDLKPLIIYLHGAGSRGNELSQMSKVGPLLELDKGRNIGAVLIAPQCHANTWFDLFEVLIEFVEFVIETEKIDKSKVYLTGVSMGGFAAWQLAMSKPELFAALVAVCGGGMSWNAGRLKNIPIWATCGALDSAVDPNMTVEMVRAVNNCGGNAIIKVYSKNGHNVWDDTYADDEMWDWLFKQKKAPKEESYKTIETGD